MNKFRFLALALIFSGALNIGLIAAFAFFMYEKTSVAAARVGKKEFVPTNGQVFAAMSRLSFRELVSFLTNRDLVEEGYTKRDLAVAVLVAYHHFNLEKALSTPPAQVRTLVLSDAGSPSDGRSIDVFPSLSESQFEAIIRFAYQEKWPLTGQGLFALLKEGNLLRDESLEQAFFLTPEFSALQVLFQRSGASQEPKALLDLAISGSWGLLEAFFKEQSKILDVSLQRRRDLLLRYLSLHSEPAAQLFLATDFAYALKRLEDPEVLELLSLLKVRREEGVRFCLELLRSPRSDAIWQAAARSLYVYAGETPALPVDPQAALARFSLDSQAASLGLKAIAPAQKGLARIEPAASSRFHIVMEGENLWKISRRYKVKIDDIVRINGLENDSLLPGMTLKLPAQGTGSEPPR